jgi:hypothetical protein
LVFGPQAGVDAYGMDDEQLWMQYLQYMTAQKKGRGQLYWKAVKALQDPANFIAGCQMLV